MILHIIRIALGLLFAFSGVLKMTDLISFHDTIEQFNILPIQFINMATILIPSLELICGLFLALGLFKKGVISILIPLVSIFVIAIAINLYRGADFDCGCFGPLQIFNSISIYSILFNLSLITMFGILFKTTQSNEIILDEIKIIVTIGLFIAFLINFPFQNTNTHNLILLKSIKDSDFEIALQMIESENAIIFDARTNNKYNVDHVPNALSLPLDGFEEYFPEYNTIDKSRLIFVYCDGSNCGAAQRVGFKLIQKGFKNISIISEGWEGWTQKK